MPQTASKSFSLTVEDVLTVTTASVPNAINGQPYTFTLEAAGGIAPYSWSVMSGSLPAGIALSAAGILSGTPSVSGPFSFVAQVTDSGV